MERYIGIDSHDESCTLCVIGATGRHIRTLVVETKATALVEAIKGVARPRHLSIEEGPLSEWLYELLEPHVDDIEVIQGSTNSGNKSDARDARWVAEAMRTNAPRTHVFKAGSKQRPLREAVKAYVATVRDLTRAKNRLNALVRSRVVRAATDTIYDPSTRPKVIGKLPSAFRPRATLFGEMLDASEKAHAAAEETLKREAKKCVEVERVASAPGIGCVRAATIVAIVVTPHRFRTARQFWAYCGLAVVTRGTSDWDMRRDGSRQRRKVAQTRGLNRNRNGALKAVFKGAAKTSITMTDHPLAMHYRAMLDKNIAPHLALLSIARRIAAAVLALWKKKEEYDPAKQMPKDAA